jgi:hypothetical protein
MRRSSGPRKTADLSESVHRQLSMYALAASAAGLGFLTSSQSADAKIVYTPAHAVVQRGWPGIVSLDLNHDGITDFNFQNWWNSNTSIGPEGFLSVLPAQRTNQTWGHSTGNHFVFFASALKAGVQVGPKAPFFWASINFWMSESNYGPWKDAKNRYLGLKFAIKGKTHYGWARLSVSSNPENRKITAILTGYAYETIANKPIIAGKTKGPDDFSAEEPDAALTMPTPQRATLGALALGAPGLSIWRREESAETTQ